MKDFISGHYINQGYCKSFQPAYINRQFKMDDMEVIQLLSQADRELGRLDMYSKYIPDIDLFIRMHVIKEAARSSRIEGTQTSVSEALWDREDIPPDRRDDWEEVQNYIKAMEWAIDNLESLPFSNRLIRETHRILLKDARGKEKSPGNFRTSQNWIGGVSLNDAIYIPPVHNTVQELMSDLEKFLHNKKIFLPELIRIGIAHYQFETIHPFLDGNGRVGRLMIPLFLVSAVILHRPVLYLSDFFERNRKLYYDNLMIVRDENNLGQWLKFFLTGIIETSGNGISTFDNILQLQMTVERKIHTLGSRAAKAKKIIDYLYKKPIINAEIVSRNAGISMPSSYKLIKDLESLEVLTEVTGGQRSRMYIFRDYLNLFN